MDELRHGLSYVREERSILALMVLGAATTFFGIPMLTLLPVFAKDVFHLEAAGFSYMMATSGAGRYTTPIVALVNSPSSATPAPIWKAACWSQPGLSIYPLLSAAPLRCRQEMSSAPGPRPHRSIPHHHLYTEYARR